MKYIITLIQVLIWLIFDTLLFIYHFRWNVYLKKTGHSFKKKNGIVSYINNAERSGGKPHYNNKYKAAFLL